MITKVKKILSVISKIFALLFTFVFGVLYVGSGIANNHADTVTDFLGQKAANIVKVDEADASAQDTEYYKSDYESVKEVRDAGIQYTQTIMEEGAVLLKNQETSAGTALPLAKGEKVSLFSVSSANPVLTGYRDSYQKPDDVVGLKEGLEAAGLDVNDELYNWYENCSFGRRNISGNNNTIYLTFTIGEAPWSALPDSKLASGYKTAIFVLSRIGGEGHDNQLRDLGESAYGADFTNGNYLMLSENERDVLDNLKNEKKKGNFDKIILLMNTTNQVQLDFVEEMDIDAVLYTGSVGTAGTLGIGRILAGDVNPSGKLPDTFWKNHYLNPVHANWGATYYNRGGSSIWNKYIAFTYDDSNSFNDGYTVYQEGIYSGYRYTETRYEDQVLGVDVGDYVYGDAVAYPFGYGLSYSEFGYSDMAVTYNAETDNYDVTVKVTNNGRVPGKNSVQLFLQKPYTEYDIQNRVEKASVELEDFAKTGVLAAGASETVKLSVPRREFASYDSYGERTYILEAGDYYLAVGTDAHDALNNILADKGKTGNDGVSDYSGKSVTGDRDLSEKITLDGADYKKYATSVTGTEITNRFDDVDLKLWEGAGETNKNSFEYLSRSDWKGTLKMGFTPEGEFLNNYVHLTKSEGIRQGLQIMGVTKEEGEMPTMGSTDTNWFLIDMMYDTDGNPLPYDDARWEELLDQLTFDEMANILSNGFTLTRAIDSIAKPLTYDYDTELGVFNAYGEQDGLASRLNDPDKNKKPAAYLDNGIVAATRNKTLIREYGVQWGEDCLWAGYTGLYGTGCNTHRSPYSGRNCGYFSEDPVLMGKCVAEMNIGMSSKGALMLLKHCVLNEQETNRCGGSSWANEQTIREVYLKSFQIAIEEGGVQGVMTALNRLGTTPAPHHDFLNKVLRDEFGMHGYNVTDSYMRQYMAIGPCILAGNDLPLDQDNNLVNYRDYPNVVNAMRDCVHNILYSVVHSNAMNGISSDMRIVTFQPEWQYYLERGLTASLVLAIVSSVFYVGMEVWSYFGKKDD